jgi:hypothetical protein
MEENFKTIKVGKEELESIKDILLKADRLQFAKVCVMEFITMEGLEEELLEKVRNASEKELISITNALLFEKEVKSVDDIINLFSKDMSDLDIFLHGLCLYDGFSIVDVYRENLQFDNVDGLFEVLLRDDKVTVLSQITDKVNPSIKSIYNDAFLETIWKTLTFADKYTGLEMWLKEMGS